MKNTLCKEPIDVCPRCGQLNSFEQAFKKEETTQEMVVAFACTKCGYKAIKKIEPMCEWLDFVSSQYKKKNEVQDEQAN